MHPEALFLIRFTNRLNFRLKSTCHVRTAKPLPARTRLGFSVPGWYLPITKYLRPSLILGHKQVHWLRFTAMFNAPFLILWAPRLKTISTSPVTVIHFGKIWTDFLLTVITNTKRWEISWEDERGRHTKIERAKSSAIYMMHIFPALLFTCGCYKKKVIRGRVWRLHQLTWGKTRRSWSCWHTWIK